MTYRQMPFLIARLLAIGVVALTWAYGVTALSPFAFDMFVKPRLFPWLDSFVAWHHVWVLAAYLASAATLIPTLRGRPSPPQRPRGAWLAAATYVVVAGAGALYLLLNPRLPLVTSDSHEFAVVHGALLALLWLSAIDHLAGWPAAARGALDEATAQPRVVIAAVGSAALLWLAASVRQAIAPAAGLGSLAWTMGQAWAFAIDMATFAIAALLLTLISAIAATRRRPFAGEYWLAVAALGGALAELLRRIVFPSLMLTPAEAATAAFPAGAVAAATYAGLRIRTISDHQSPHSGLDLVLAFRGTPLARRILLVVVPVATAVGIAAVEPIDWAFVLRNLLVVLQAAVVFGLILDATRRAQRRPWSLRLLVAPTLGALVALHVLPVVARAAAEATGDLRAAPQQLLDRYAASDALTSLAAGALIEQQETDPDFYPSLLAAEGRLANLNPQPPAASFSLPGGGPPSRPPHVFLFVIDSLRRDYLSPYNGEVSFTPAIERWARDQFVFRNAFTRYGGTWLSVPSLWTGTMATRRWGTIFPEVNAMERLVVDAGYDFVINDFTVANLLRPDTPRTFLDPDIKSVDTDLCRNLSSLEAHIDRRTTSEPIFAYLAPMNVHILNTRPPGRAPASDPSGFFAPYASRLQRLDECFGNFVDYLQRTNLFEDSVIIVTSDHGDSLGTEGRWGHQFYLFPEVLRIPLIVQVPESRRAGVTTDLGRLAFASDIVPSLLALLGYDVPDLGPTSGSPLFVAPDEAPVPRRRDAFVVMSSYGSSYGLLRRNGRLLYMVDLVNRKEAAMAVDRDPLGEPIPVTGALRRLSRAAILEGLAEVERLFSLR